MLMRVCSWNLTFHILLRGAEQHQNQYLYLSEGRLRAIDAVRDLATDSNELLPLDCRSHQRRYAQYRKGRPRRGNQRANDRPCRLVVRGGRIDENQFVYAVLDTVSAGNILRHKTAETLSHQYRGFRKLCDSIDNQLRYLQEC